MSSALGAGLTGASKAPKPQSLASSHIIRVRCPLCSQLVPRSSKRDVHHSALPTPPLDYRLPVYFPTGNHPHEGHGAAGEVHVPCSQVEGHRAQSSGASQGVETREIRPGQQGRGPRQAQQQVIVLTLSLHMC